MSNVNTTNAFAQRAHSKRWKEMRYCWACEVCNRTWRMMDTAGADHHAPQRYDNVTTPDIMPSLICRCCRRAIRNSILAIAHHACISFTWHLNQMLKCVVYWYNNCIYRNFVGNGITMKSSAPWTLNDFLNILGVTDVPLFVLWWCCCIPR